MNAYVTPDAVEAAARAMHETDDYTRAVSWDKAGHHVRQAYMDNARAALAAAAPLIAKQTLLDAAKSAWLTPEVQRWLTDRAATPTPKEN